MKILRIVLICLAVYVGIVVVFESLLGVIQPQPEGILVLTTFDEGGGAHDRVLSRIDVGDQLYVTYPAIDTRQLTLSVFDIADL